MALKSGPIRLMGVAAIVASGIGGYALHKSGTFAAPAAPANVPTKVALPTSVEHTSTAKVSELPLPSDKVLGEGPEIRYALWAWNAQQGLILANGGPKTTAGSIMATNGVGNLYLKRQDDAMAMQTELIKFAEELKSGVAQPSSGYHFVAIMGDGAAAFLQGIQPQLEKLGPEYKAEIVGSAGFSRGEDKFMGQPEWKEDPQLAKGSLISVYLRDGDWNIVMKWAADNGIKVNPDETTWDPDAINWYAASTYIEAAQKYIANKCEDRPVVQDGKRVGGEPKNVCITGVSTWTPGDVMVAQERGGLVSIVSTKEYRWQMPNTIIGIKKWNLANRSLVENMLRSIYQGGDQVKTSQAAARKAAELSAVVYGEQDGDYWQRYFNVRKEKDAQNILVELGGSSVNNLADVMYLYGLLPGSSNIFAETYTGFGKLVVEQYPLIVPTFPPIKDILNTSYTKAIAAGESVSIDDADVPLFDLGGEVDELVSQRSYKINFQTGSAKFTPQAEKVLKELYTSIVVTGLNVEVHGHTDNVGSPENNQVLSESRAFAVKEYLQTLSPANFPDTRVAVKAFGQTAPVAKNDTADGRAKNRRVEIVLGVKN